MEQVAWLTDVQIERILFYPRKKDGSLDLGRESGRRRRKLGRLPSAEEIRLPPGALELPQKYDRHVTMEFVYMWWQVWRSRQESQGLSDEQLSQKWEDYLKGEAGQTRPEE